MSVVKVVVSVFVILFGQMVTMYQHSESAEKYFVGEWRITHVEVKYHAVNVSKEDEPKAKCVFREDGTGEFMGKPFKWGVGSKFAHMNFGDQTYYARVFEGKRLVILAGAKEDITGYLGLRSETKDMNDSARSNRSGDRKITGDTKQKSDSQPEQTSVPQPTTECQTK